VNLLKGDKAGAEQCVDLCVKEGALNETSVGELENIVQRHLEPILANPMVQSMNVQQRLELLELIASSYDSK
jgi:hypothetical protein